MKAASPLPGSRLGQLRSAVEAGKALGLIRGPGDKAPVNLAGTSAAAFEGVRIQFMIITPDIARQWLGNNQGNRTLKHSTIEAYARDMRNSAWLTTHQGIAFNDKETLIDGQHRLHAVIESGVSVMMLVSTGWPTQPKGKKARTMDTVDRGVVRSVADILQLQHGFSKSRHVVMTATILGRLCTENSNKASKLSAPAVLAIVEAFPEGIRHAVEHAPTTIGLRQAVVLGSVAFAYSAAPKEVAAFYERLQTGESLGKDSPVLHLRNWLLSGKRIGYSRSDQIGACETVLMSLLLFIQKEPANKLITSTSEVAINHFRLRVQAKVDQVAKLFEGKAAK